MQALAAVEWAGWAFRVFNLVSTDRYFLHTIRMQVLFVVLLLVNAVLLVQSLRRRGPFTWGRRGVVFEIVVSAAPMVLFAVLLPGRTFQGRLPYELPMANNMFPIALFLAVYRRSSRPRGREWWTALVDYAFVGLLVPLFGFSALLNGYGWSEIRWVNLASQAATTMVAVAMGQGLWRVVRDFADAEVMAADAQHESFSAWLHSELLGSLASLRRQCEEPDVDVAELLGGIEILDGAVRSGQHRLTLDQDSVAVADVVSHQVRRFRAVIEIISPGMLGGWRADGMAARHIDRVLGDLLTNAVQSGARSVTILVDRSDGGYTVTVTDNGSGLPDGVLSQPETSLGRLAHSTAAVGGRLEGWCLGPGEGTRMVAFIPTKNS